MMLDRIRATVRKIPRGKVSTYGAVARAAGFPGAARQVVKALRSGYGLPWQRVVAAGGRIALPGERGLEQRFRLETEGVKFSGKRVRMKDFEFKFRKGKVAASRSRAATGSGRRSRSRGRRQRPPR